jgi:hypothetical protein
MSHPEFWTCEIEYTVGEIAHEAAAVWGWVSEAAGVQLGSLVLGSHEYTRKYAESAILKYSLLPNLNQQIARAVPSKFRVHFFTNKGVPDIVGDPVADGELPVLRAIVYFRLELGFVHNDVSGFDELFEACSRTQLAEKFVPLTCDAWIVSRQLLSRIE